MNARQRRTKLRAVEQAYAAVKARQLPRPRHGPTAKTPGADGLLYRAVASRYTVSRFYEPPATAGH